MYLNKNTSKPELEICDRDYNPTVRKSVQKQQVLLEYCSSLQNEKSKAEVIPTNISELDKILGGGLRPGIFVFGANPGLGKTSLMLHLMIELALQEQYTLLFNLEMSVQQVQTRLLSNFSYRKSLIDNSKHKFSINELSSLKDILNFKDDYNELVHAYADEIDKYINIISKSEDLHMEGVYGNNSSSYVERIESALINYYNYYKIKPVIIVDFLQLLETEIPEEDNGKVYDKRLETNLIIDKLKKYSNVYQATIILISSLSRNSYTKTEDEDDDFVYDLSIFKESGHIEYTGDFLALLTQGKSKVSFTGEEPKIININVLKTRYSQYAGERTSLVFLPEYSYFEIPDNN